MKIPATKEKGQNKYEPRLCKYLDKRGDSRIVKKAQATAVQD
jgi:hypothetical protein